MNAKQEQINELRTKIQSLLNLKDELDEETFSQKMAKLEGQLQELGIETGGGAVVAGNVSTGGGDFVGRDSITNNIYQGEYHGLAPRTDQEALDIYRGVLIDRCGLLPLHGLSDQTSDATASRPRLSLPGVYIQLDTKFTVDEKKLASAYKKGSLASLDELLPTRKQEMMGREMAEGKPLAALQAAILKRKLVLLGDPGSGKTTFVNFIAYCVAARDWERLRDWPETEQDILPVLVTLRDFAYWLAGQDKRTCEHSRALWAYIEHDLEMRNLAFIAPQLEKALQEGHAFLLLDGLDEVTPTPEGRGAVLRFVEEFAERYPTSRYLATCRILSYEDAQWRLDEREFPCLTLAPFDDEQISAFIHAWHTEIAAKWNQPRRELEKLESKLRGEVSRREDLKRLAPNPLLLTVMALVHTSDGELPEARALLYERAVEILLWRWDQQKSKAQGEESRIITLLREAGRDRGDLLVRLAKLAFLAQQQVREEDSKEEITGISQNDLLKELRELHPARSLDWAEAVVETMKLRAGLLLERTGGVFTFPHRTFQEYLAGVHLARQPNFTAEAKQCLAQGDFWRIVVLLAVGHLVHSGTHDYEKPLWLAEELCPAEIEDTLDGWKRAWLAGEVLLELGLYRCRESERGRRLLQRVRERLAALLEGGQLTPRQRLEAGDALGALGDPRFDERRCGLPVLLHGQPEPLLGFVHVPAGKFRMGSDKKDEQAYEDEKPAHTLELAEFYIARYPVTNAQYRFFLDDKGYDKERYWTLEGWGWRNGANFDLSAIKDKSLRDTYQNALDARPVEKRGQPYWWNHPQWGAPNRPVMGVSWYEALAYCRWLEEQWPVVSDQCSVISNQCSVSNEQGAGSSEQGAVLRWQGLAEGRLHVSLPSEAQWEKAARGEQGWRWPWGDEWGADHANINIGETGLKQTSPVGMFPAGASLYGALDMAGNVWEWTASRWGKDFSTPDYRYPYRENDGRNDLSGGDLRLLRGGSWISNQRTARCASRYRDIPANFHDDVGFRVVVSLAISDI